MPKETMLEDAFEKLDINHEHRTREALEPVLVNWDDVIPTRIVGSHKGQSGKTFKALVNGEKVFVKKFQDLKAQRNELKIFMALGHHANVVKLKSMAQKNKKGLLVLEWMTMDLKDFLYSNKFRNFDWKERVKLAIEVANGLWALHSVGVVHRDIKPENVLISKDGRVKWTDFGLSTIKHSSTEKLVDRKQVRGNALYMAPEVWNLKPFDESSDVFGYGFLLWEIINGRHWEPPSCYSDRDEYKRFICELKLRPQISKEIPLRIATLMQRCWHASPERRPSSFEIIKELCSIYMDYPR